MDRSTRRSTNIKFTAGRAASAFLLRLDGRLTVEADLRALNRTINLIAARHPSVVLDLGGVDQIDCSGIGCLVRLHNQFVASGRTLILSSVRPRVKMMLQLAGLLAVIPVCEGPREAVFWNSWRQGRFVARVRAASAAPRAAALRIISSRGPQVAHVVSGAK